MDGPMTLPRPARGIFPCEGAWPSFPAEGTMHLQEEIHSPPEAEELTALGSRSQRLGEASPTDAPQGRELGGQKRICSIQERNRFLSESLARPNPWSVTGLPASQESFPE